MKKEKALLVGVVTLLLSARPTDRQSAALPACDPDNGGITLPAGFCAVVVADQVGAPRHLAVGPNGDLFVALQSRPGGVLALRDTTGDGKADVTERFGSEGGTGIALGKGVLYFSSTTTVYRYTMRAGSLVPLGALTCSCAASQTAGMQRATWRSPPTAAPCSSTSDPPPTLVR